jgi:hypothetical protein
MTPRDPCTRGCAMALLALGAFLAVGQHAWAFDPEDVYRQGALVISGEAGYGTEIHFYDTFTGLEVQLGHVASALRGVADAIS